MGLRDLSYNVDWDIKDPSNKVEQKPYKTDAKSIGKYTSLSVALF